MNKDVIYMDLDTLVPKTYSSVREFKQDVGLTANVVLQVLIENRLVPVYFNVSFDRPNRLEVVIGDGCLEVTFEDDPNTGKPVAEINWVRTNVQKCIESIQIGEKFRAVDMLTIAETLSRKFGASHIELTDAASLHGLFFSWYRYFSKGLLFYETYGYRICDYEERVSVHSILSYLKNLPLVQVVDVANFGVSVNEFTPFGKVYISIFEKALKDDRYKAQLKLLNDVIDQFIIKQFGAEIILDFCKDLPEIVVELD